jgi:superfamily II DNA/RNA helicase
MSTLFSTLGLAAPLQSAVAELGYRHATPVQAEAIPAALAGTDWMISSQTGSGKTAAYLLPCLHALIEGGAQPMRALPGPGVLVLCPTRELAQQVAAEAISLVRHVRGIRIATVVGGMPFGKQVAGLRGAAIVIATPGRLLDLYRRRQLRLDQVMRMVVDEADRMLDLGFAEDLEEIHRLCQQRQQTLMYSATFAPRVMQLAARVMREPGRIELNTAQDRHADITQKLHWADGLAHKKKLLDHWLRDAELDQAVVFASTQADTEIIANELAEIGHSVAALHGAMPQAVRNRRIKSLREGHIRILVATDVAARGIDVPNISHVINFGLPMKAEDYVHRIGRTGRAGRSGIAVTLAEHREGHKIRDIERFTRQSIAAHVIPGLEPAPRSAAPRGAARPPSRGAHGRGEPAAGARGKPSGDRWRSEGRAGGRPWTGSRERADNSGRKV